MGSPFADGLARVRFGWPFASLLSFVGCGATIFAVGEFALPFDFGGLFPESMVGFSGGTDATLVVVVKVLSLTCELFSDIVVSNVRIKIARVGGKSFSVDCAP